MTEDDQFNRAAHAKRLADDEVLKAAFETVRNRFKEHAVAGELSHADKREAAFRMMKATDEVWFQLQSWLSEGKIIEDRRKLRGKSMDA